MQAEALEGAGARRSVQHTPRTLRHDSYVTAARTHLGRSRAALTDYGLVEGPGLLYIRVWRRDILRYRSASHSIGSERAGRPWTRFSRQERTALGVTDGGVREKLLE